MMCSCDQLRKLVAQVRPVGRMSLEPWYQCWIFFFNLQTMIYSKVWIKYTFVKSLKDIETDETSISQNAALLKNLFKESYFP